MAQTIFGQQAEPVINVIGQSVPGSSGTPASSDDRQGTLDLAAMDAASDRRRREFDAARARLRDQAMRDDPGTSRQAGPQAPAEAAPASTDAAPENLGRRLATLRVPIPDGEGKVIGEEDKDVYWNTWPMEVVQRDRAASTSPSPSASPADGEPRSADSRVPPVTEDEPRRDGVQRPESEQALHLAVLTAAMREQGFSERPIARVQQRAARMLVAFEREGIVVPTPKVFDPEAPSGRDRHGRQTPGREPAREIDRTPAGPSSMSPSR